MSSQCGAGYQSDTVSGSTGASSSQSSSESTLRKYISSFGPETVKEMARVASQEATTLIEMQTVALFGDYRLLQKEMEVGPKSHLN